MGTVRTGWEDRFCLSTQTTGISTPGTFTATDNGIGAAPGAGACGLLLNSHPNFEAGKVQDFADKSTGIAENKYDTGNVYEYTDGRRQPTVSLEMGLTAPRLATFLWLLCQKGASEEEGDDKTFIVPTAGNSGCEVWASIGRAIGAGTAADGHAIHGAVCNQLQISGNNGERVNLTANMTGKTMVTNFNHTASNFDIDTGGEEMFFDFTTMTLAGTSIVNFAESFSLDISNNMAARFYGGQTPSAYVLQKFTTSGNIKLAMSADTVGDNKQIDNFVAGTDVALVLSKGLSGASGYISITLNCLYTGASVDPAEELLLDLPFDCVNDGTNASFSIVVNDGLTRAIPA